MINIIILFFIIGISYLFFRRKLPKKSMDAAGFNPACDALGGTGDKLLAFSARGPAAHWADFLHETFLNELEDQSSSLSSHRQCGCSRPDVHSSQRAWALRASGAIGTNRRWNCRLGHDGTRQHQGLDGAKGLPGRSRL